MPSRQKLTEQEWSHFFDIDDLDKHRATELTITASEEECADLARRFAIEGIRDVEAKLTLNGESGGNKIYVQGEFSCIVMQTCVVSLEPLETKLSEPVDGWFADKESAVSFAAAKKEREVKRTHGEVEITEEKDDPEDVVEGRIDLGELVAQHISLTIPGYPQKEGVAYENGDDKIQIDEKSPLRKNPFEALKDWKEER